MPDEEAFCVLVRLMDSYNLRSHYLADMPGLQLRLFQFDRLMEEILPLLHTSFLRKGIKSSMFASQWFMTLFSYRLVRFRGPECGGYLTDTQISSGSGLPRPGHRLRRRRRGDIPLLSRAAQKVRGQAGRHGV
jgi:hypothetical protein